MSPFEHLNCVIKNFIKLTSTQPGSVLEESVETVNSSVEFTERRYNTGRGIRKAKLARAVQALILLEKQPQYFDL